MRKSTDIKQQDRPAFLFYRRFKVPVIAWRHPVRLAAFVLLMMLFFPELQRLAQDGFAINALAAGALVAILGFALFYGLLLGTYYLEYTLFPVRLYDDRLEVRDSLLLNENLKVPYRNLLEIKTSANGLQALYGLKTLRLKLRSGSDARNTRDYWFDITDIKNASDIACRLSSLQNR